jgi:hypothetical protein
MYPSAVVLLVAWAWAHSASRSTHALPRACSEAASPSSHTAMMPSLLSSSLSWVRSCSYSLSTITDIATTPGGGEGLHQLASGDQCYEKKQAQATADTE